MPLAIRIPPPRPTATLAALVAVASLVSLTDLVTAQTTKGPTRPPAPSAAAPSASAIAGLSPNDPWDTLVADVTITTRRVSRTGEPTGVAAPPLRYRFERSRASGHWKSTFIVLKAGPRILLSRDGEVPVDDSLEIARIEDDQDGSAARFYDGKGRLVRPPTEADLSWMQRDTTSSSALATPGHTTTRPNDANDVAWVDAFIATKTERTNRRVSLLRGHSATRGRVRGLDRFVATEADQSREVLVDPSSALPIEMNLMRGGTLVSHRTMRYEAGPGGTLVRRAMRSERLVSPVSGERAVVDTEFTSVRLERRR